MAMKKSLTIGLLLSLMGSQSEHDELLELWFKAHVIVTTLAAALISIKQFVLSDLNMSGPIIDHHYASLF
jgi:hypothetical protein